MSISHEGTSQFLWAGGCLTVLCVGVMGVAYLVLPILPQSNIKEPIPLTSPLPSDFVINTPYPLETTIPLNLEFPTAYPATNPTQTVDGIYYAPSNITYPYAQDPEGSGRVCVEIPPKGTVFGGAVVVGPNPKTYNDTPKINVFSFDGKVIGSFPTSEMPSSRFSEASPETIICP